MSAHCAHKQAGKVKIATRPNEGEKKCEQTTSKLLYLNLSILFAFSVRIIWDVGPCWKAQSYETFNDICHRRGPFILRFSQT